MSNPSANAGPDHPSATEITRPCSWCHHSQTRTEKQGTHVVLFTCSREHFIAHALCVECARRAEGNAARRAPYVCRDCAPIGEAWRPAPPMVISLVTTFPLWMQMLDQGLVRFCRPADQDHVGADR